MKPFLQIEGVAAPIPAANIDTDVIMPKQFLKGVDRSGLSAGLFHDQRYDSGGQPRPDFILNQAPWRSATFLVVGPNFGCGSSREHAVWGLQQFGIRALVGTTYGSIFFDNCARNGLLAITLGEPELDLLLTETRFPNGALLKIDLPQQHIISCGGNRFPFAIDEARKTALVQGLDFIESTLALRAEIEQFEAGYFERYPWLGSDT